MGIDWSKAPPHATHWCPGNAKIEAGWIYNPGGNGGEFYSCYADKGLEHIPEFPEWRKLRLVPRPSKTSLTGEVLPPVGTTCKLSGPTERLSPLNPDWAGREVKIYAHFVSDRGIEMAAYVGERHDIGGVGIAALFVPIRTPEQIAAEKRKTAIKEMQSDTECHVYADVFGRLYDAGYRKQVTP